MPIRQGNFHFLAGFANTNPKKDVLGDAMERNFTLIFANPVPDGSQISSMSSKIKISKEEWSCWQMI